MGQICGLSRGHTRGTGGTSLDALESLVGGGLVEPDLEVWVPLWWSQDHHKVGGVSYLSAAQGSG